MMVTMTTRALVSGRILKRSGHVILRGAHATSHTSTRPQWEGSVRKALHVGAVNLVVHSRGLDDVADYMLNGQLR